jgi:hypothetical protein
VQARGFIEDKLCELGLGEVRGSLIAREQHCAALNIIYCRSGRITFDITFNHI